MRPLDIDFDEDHYAKVYRSSEDLPIPWVANASSDLPLVPSGSQVVILVRARDATDLSRQLPGDLALAGKVSETIVPHDPQSLIGILVPRDFEDLHEPDKENLLAAAQRLGIYILVCPETSTALNTDAIRRLATSRITRE